MSDILTEDFFLMGDTARRIIAKFMDAKGLSNEDPGKMARNILQEDPTQLGEEMYFFMCAEPREAARILLLGIPQIGKGQDAENETIRRWCHLQQHLMRFRAQAIAAFLQSGSKPILSLESKSRIKKWLSEDTTKICNFYKLDCM